MRTQRAWLFATCLAVLGTAGRAHACNASNDPNCTTSSTDPCDSYSAIPADHQVCEHALPSCSQFSGAPLTTCLAHAVTVARGPAPPPPPPPPPSPPLNHAIGWNATKQNHSLFDDKASANEQQGNYNVQIDAAGMQISDGGGNFLSQNDAFQAHANLLVACTSTNASGRTDAICLANPNDPECTGMNAALGNAVACAQPGPIDPATGQPTCLAYGAFGYNVDEWLVFGQQYFNSMSGCFAVSDTADSTGINPTSDRVVDRRGRLGNLTDFAAFPPAGVPQGHDGTSASTISGEPGKSKAGPAPAMDWKTISAKVDDGASYLGLERGELIRRSAAGQSFSSAFSDSPFAERLAKDTRAVVEAALANPVEIVDRVKAKNLAKLGNDATTDDSAVTATHSPNPARMPASLSAAPSGKEEKSQTASLITLESASAAAGGARTAGSVRRDSEKPEKNNPGRDLADARSLLGGGTTGHGTHDNFQSSPELGSAEASLFERVTLSYRRYAPQLKAYGESGTARDVRLTERPAFFRDL